MYYDRTDEYGFDSSLEGDSLPIELSCGCEDQPSPKEEICLAPEEQNAPEYGTSSKRSDEQNGEDIYETVKKAIFTVTASVVAALSVLFSAAGADPLGNDFLSVNKSSVTKKDTYSTSDSYGNSGKSLNVEKYTDSFPDLPNPDPDFDGKYAWSLISPSPGFEGGTEEYLVVDSNYLVAGTVYTNSGIKTGNISGASYDRDTNTLTLKNYHGGFIDANLMGNGFKINLVGESSLDYIKIWGAMYGGSVTFTGSGSITINQSGNAPDGAGLYLECEDSMSCVMIDRQATVEVFGEYAIVIHRTLLKKAIYTLKPIKMSGGEYSTGEFVEYTVTEQLPDGTSRQTVKTVKDIAKETGKSLYDYSVVGSNGKPSKHVVFTPSK